MAFSLGTKKLYSIRIVQNNKFANHKETKINLKTLIIILLVVIFLPVFGQQEKFSKEILDNPKNFSTEFEKLFNYNEIKTFDNSKKAGRVVLENGYVKSEIKNPQDWLPYNNKVIVTQIDIIFTKYPKNKDFWRTNYYELLANRVKELLKIDSSLNSSNFEWNLVLQTGCETETEAKNMFHGISIKYFEVEDLMSEREIDETPMQDSSYFIDHALKVANYIRSQGGIGDSVIYKVLERQKGWKNALVVMDWTGSMYKYGAQAVLWHTLNFNTSGIKNFVFFNDGNNMPDERKSIGETGGVYYSQAKNLDRLINTFYLVGNNGNGGDVPENDFEAIIKGMNRFEDFDELILIADNNSCVRDFALLENIDVKVNIIVCGFSGVINPQYVNLAYHTGGSVHTMEDDIDHLNKLVKDDVMVIDNIKYKLDTDDFFRMQYQSGSVQFSTCEDMMNVGTLKPNPHLEFLERHGGITDSTVYKVLDRHPLWQNSVVVLDFTKEMYTTSSQAILWHKLNKRKSGIDDFVFFNDGNKLQKRKKKVGKTGGIYSDKSSNVKRVERRLDYISKRGNGGTDDANNDIEALLYAATKYRDAKEIILIADNRSCMRDYSLLKLLNIPIKVIITNVNGPINPQYLNLAYQTGGSIHTLNDDIYDYVFTTTKESNRNLLIDGIEYRLNKDNEFELVDMSKKLDCECSKYSKKGFLNNLFNP